MPALNWWQSEKPEVLRQLHPMKSISYVTRSSVERVFLLDFKAAPC